MRWEYYLLIVNLLAFVLYWHDKHQARRSGAARVPEYILLLAGFAGGTVGALLGQRLLRHKTKKTSFQFKFWALTIVQLLLLAFPPQALQILLSRAFV